MTFFQKPKKPEEPAEPVNQELADLRTAIERVQLPEAAVAVAKKELERLEKMDPGLPEYTIGSNYIEYLTSLPWTHFTEDNLDMKRTEDILESQHYGLKHVKERILEYLAVRTLCNLRTGNILVVDDEEIARINMEHVLRKEGHQVTTACNGLEALEKLKKREYDLILTDFKMEKMDGMQLIKSVKQIAPHTQIVMITGYATIDSA
ncbi:MAG: response regulator, partial [Deltaproteobacteria bacterium]|nr:response regulator [Deltaproteobacteria bacterium]